LKNGVVKVMEAETAKAKMKMEEQSREELIALIYEMAKEISELKAEIERLKQPPTTSQNSSQPPSRDFKSSTEKKRKRSKKKGAKPGHEKQERQLVEKPNKVIEVYADHCGNCHHNLSSSSASDPSSDYRTTRDQTCGDRDEAI
jgi:hypothetical protein